MKTMHRYRLLSALACTLFLGSAPALAQRTPPPPPPSANEDANEINLAVGEARTTSARDVKNYSEGVGGIVDIKLTSDATQFVINGKRPGSTTLLLIKTDGSQNTLNINVFARSPAAVEKELNQLLTGLPVKPRRVGAQIVLDGVVESEAELQKVHQIASMYREQVTSLVQVAGVGGPAQGGGGPGGGPMGPPRRFLIRIDFYFVQYDRNSSYGVGIGWPDSFGAGSTVQYSYDFLAGTTRTATATLANQPLPRLDIASKRGWAKVLKQATVITSNDTEAQFSNGGEQNFPVNTGLTIGVQKIPFGTTLNVMPHYDPDRRELTVKLDAEVADLTAAISGTALPGRSTSRLLTNVTLRLGQSLVLSGIRTQSLTHSVAGLPGLSEIPLLGILFGSHANSNLETEGAIFVVPSVVQAVPPAAAELVDLAIQKFKDFGGDVQKVNAYDKTPGGSGGVPR